MTRRLKQTQLKAVRQDFVDKQGGRCAICYCPLPNDAAVMDHDHKTGYLRAALCRNCNGIEGKIKNLCNRGKRQFDQLWYIKRILDYWETHDVDKPEHGLMYPTHKTADEKRLAINKKARLKRAKAKKV